MRVKMTNLSFVEFWARPLKGLGNARYSKYANLISDKRDQFAWGLFTFNINDVQPTHQETVGQN